MKCLMVMEPINTIEPRENTSFAIMLEAKRRGWGVSVCGIGDVVVDAHEVYVHAMVVEALRDQVTHYIDCAPKVYVRLKDFDLVFMRQEPPVDARYVQVTQLLEFAAVRVVNSAAALREFNEKLGILHFAKYCPETLVTANIDLLHDFVDKHQTIICKSLDKFASVFVFSVSASDINRTVIFETVTQQGSAMVMAQRFIPDILTEGDRRIILIQGKPIPFALVRQVARYDFRDNLSCKSVLTVTPLTPREHEITAHMAPFLREKKLDFVGLDVIGGWITEINVTAPGSARQLSDMTGINICKLFLDAIE